MRREVTPDLEIRGEGSRLPLFIVNLMPPLSDVNTLDVPLMFVSNEVKDHLDKGEGISHNSKMMREGPLTQHSK